MMKTLCFTVDLDRDVNIPIEGKLAAGSVDRGRGTAPRFKTSEEGLALLVKVLDEVGVKATFFAEGRTLDTIENAGLLHGHEVGIHGFDHEDLTGVSDEDVLSEIIQGSIGAVRDATSCNPICARAPYMKIDCKVADAFRKAGMKYDSSEYCAMSREIFPYERNGLTVVPVPEGIDANGRKISAYLWPMHEGVRIPDDYIAMGKELENGIFCIATHTWHMAESRKNGIMGKSERRANAEKVKTVLEGLLDSGMKPMTISEAAKRFTNTSVKSSNFQ